MLRSTTGLILLSLLWLPACAPGSSWSQPGVPRLSGRASRPAPTRIARVQAVVPAADHGSSAVVTPTAPPAPFVPAAPGSPEATITSDEIREHVEVLASDLFEGREAGSKGERRAAAYIVSRLEECTRLEPAGDDGSWFHEFELNGLLAGTPARNVIARLPGSDPDVAHEIIVIGAHYDHVGYGKHGNALDGSGEIHNGADDNASGSAALLELATSLCAEGWEPRRTILFQWYSGEELGLLGSMAWVAEHDVLRERVVFMVNMDMVGRLTGRTLVVGGTGTSPGLSELAQGLCDELGLVMIDDPPGTAPSDNTAFYREGIPALFLFTGLHEDYHRAGDDVHKLNAVGAADIGKLAAGLVRAIDGRDERPRFTPSPGNAFMFRPRLFTGAVFGEAADGAPRLAVLLPDSPAEEVGLAEGDVIVALDGAPMETLAQLEAALKAVGTDVRPLDFSVRREGEADLLVKRVQPTIR
ncbi:MAG: M28 family peptidase [Planctomycetota bacterium]|jgi:hypothetical protein